VSEITTKFGKCTYQNCTRKSVVKLSWGNVYSLYTPVTISKCSTLGKVGVLEESVVSSEPGDFADETTGDGLPLEIFVQLFAFFGRESLGSLSLEVNNVSSSSNTLGTGLSARSNS
jgi:hypothetical protein